MEITTLDSFLGYYENLRARTLRVIAAIPPNEIEWSPTTGKWSLGDIIRHIAGIERYMYAETVSGRPSRYTGCGRDLADGFDATLAYMNGLHAESMDMFRALTPEQLHGKCMTPAGSPITTWKWLRAMLEHEIHHRGQIYTYLGILGVTTPPLYGLTSELVAAKAAR